MGLRAHRQKVEPGESNRVYPLHSSDKTASCAEGGAQSGAVGNAERQPDPHADAGLAVVIDARPSLPPVVRTDILAIVNAGKT